MLVSLRNLKIDLPHKMNLVTTLVTLYCILEPLEVFHDVLCELLFLTLWVFQYKVKLSTYINMEGNILKLKREV